MTYPTEKQIKKANKYGIQDAKSGDWSSWWNKILGVAYDLGQAGIDLSDQPVVNAHRWGQTPDEGISINHAENTAEKGCSCAFLDDNPDDNYGYLTQASGAECVAIKGVLVPDTGSDGEPLVLLTGKGVDFD